MNKKLTEELNAMRVRAGLLPQAAVKPDWKTEPATEADLKLVEEWKVKGNAGKGDKIHIVIEMDHHRKAVKVLGAFKEKDDAEEFKKPLDKKAADEDTLTYACVDVPLR